MGISTESSLTYGWIDYLASALRKDTFLHLALLFCLVLFF